METLPLVLFINYIVAMMISNASRLSFLAKGLSSFNCSEAVTRTLSSLPKIQESYLNGLEKNTGDSEWTKLTNKIKQEWKNDGIGRLFAVVHAAGKQRKITTEDIIVLDKPIEADIGDKIRLNKVLMVGGNNFSLLGRPILKPNIASVEATVIEKGLSHNKVLFWYRKRKSSRFFKLRKVALTSLRINDICIKQKIE